MFRSNIPWIGYKVCLIANGGHMKLLLKTLLILSVFTQVAFTQEIRWITVGADAINSIRKDFKIDFVEEKSNEEISVVGIDEKDLVKLSQMMHEKFNRCGGFMAFDSLEEAEKSASAYSNREFATKSIFADYEINQMDIVNALIKQVDEFKIRSTINKLSSFKNRYYKSKFGVQSSMWIKDHWTSLSQHRKDARVELFNHSRWSQPTVIMTLEGKSDEVIIIGGHADSISGYINRNNARAPGADDNASGIAVITEVIRILMQTDYVPEKTIKFMAYSAEEVGLLGSKDVAKSYKVNGVNVIGVMQLDMTNYKGSNVDIVLMTDFTNSEQNSFIGNLIDEYLKNISWGTDKCGYACSDHASWTNQGFPASMPFESKTKKMNRKIHTSRDTIAVSGGNADHAAKFAKMAIAFAVEMDK